MIDRAELIQGFRFIKLEDMIKWKQKMGREKDMQDIELVRKYF
jgi:predicted nucleotidyltransferase